MYARIFKKNLHVHDIDADNLKSYTTTEKDFNRSIDRFPPITYRNIANDILDEGQDELDGEEKAMDISKALVDKGNKNN